MTRRLSFLLPVALAGGLLLVPACGKKNPTPSGPGLPGDASASSDYVFYAHLDAKQVTNSDLFGEVKKAMGGMEGPMGWDGMMTKAQSSLGVKPTDLASVSIFVTDVPMRNNPQLGGRAAPGEPNFVVIVKADKAIDKAAALKAMEFGTTEPDAKGFYRAKNGPGALHFPNETTAVLLNPALADQYLAGFGKDGSGWPLTASLSKAAEGHTAYLHLNAEKLPAELKTGPQTQPVAPLLAAKAAALTLDLKGKSLELNLNAAFPDAAAAGQAKDLVAQYVGLGRLAVDGAATGKSAEGMGAMLPLVTEAQKTLKEAKIEVKDAALTVSAKYDVKVDFGALAADAARKVKIAAERMTSSNNMKQLGLAVHIYSDANGGVFPILGVGPRGMPRAKATDKPLLSWRVAILPYIEQKNLYDQFKFDEPWDSEHNKKLIPLMPKTFAIPGAKGDKPGFTRYQMVVGPNAMPEPSVRMPASFPDGTSNTVMLVEAAEAVEWTKPADVMLPGKELTKDLRKKFGGVFTGGFHVALWDGSIRFVSDRVSDRTLGLALDPKDGNVLGSDW